MHRSGHRRGDVGIVEDNARRLAAQFLVNALDRWRGLARDGDSGAGRAGKADHVDLRVSGDGSTDRESVTVDEVEHARWDTGSVEDLGEDDGGEGRDFAWLQDHRAAGGESRKDLRGDLIDRPVPRGDEAAHADRLANDGGRAALLLEGEVREDGDRGLEMSDAGGRLSLLCEGRGGAHFLSDSGRNVGVARLIFGGDPGEQREPLCAAGLAEGGKGASRCSDRCVDVGLSAKADPSRDLLGGGVYHVERPRTGRVDPAAADVELQCVTHR